MSLQLAFLLTFIAGGLSVWLLIRMSRQSERERMDAIKKRIIAFGGEVIDVEIVDRVSCPFSSEYQDPDLAYKFYKVTYHVGGENKHCWAVLEMKQPGYGPGGAIQTNWIWRDLN